MKATDFTYARKYFQSLRLDERRQRNMTSQAGWVWHDIDGILKYNKDGYFEDFHERFVTLFGVTLKVQVFEDRNFNKICFREWYLKKITFCGALFRNLHRFLT